MSTNLHNIKFPMISRIRRVKSSLAQRKKKRTQVFLSNRLRHFLASNEQIGVQIHAIYEHLNLISSSLYSMEEKGTAFLVIMISRTPQIADLIGIERTSEFIQHLNDKLHALLSSIWYILNEITINYLLANKYNINIDLKCENLILRTNDNSISNLMAELLSRLLVTFSNRCETTKVQVTKQILDAFELCYHHFSHNRDIMERNVHTIFTLIQGTGRLDRTNSIVERHSLVQQLMYQHINESAESLIVLKIVNCITRGSPENINILLNHNLLDYLQNQLTNASPQSYAMTKECFSILENLCGNHRSDIQAVINSNLILPLINVFKAETNDLTLDLRKIALDAFYNISSLGSTEQHKVLLDLDLLHLLCCQLKCTVVTCENIIETTLEVMNNILGDLYRKDHHSFHIVLFRVSNDNDNFFTFKRLAVCNDESISSIAKKLIKHNTNKCQKCNKMPFQISIG